MSVIEWEPIGSLAEPVISFEAKRSWPLDVHGIPVYESQYVAPTQVVYLSPLTGQQCYVVHPLTAIAYRHPSDPLGRLEEAMGWCLRRALRRLDRLERTL